MEFDTVATDVVDLGVEDDPDFVEREPVIAKGCCSGTYIVMSDSKRVVAENSLTHAIIP